MIRVCLADDQALMRSGLKALFRLLEDVEVVAEAGDGEAAIAVVLSSKPDVLLLDVRMPRLNGVEVIQRLAHQRCLPPTLLLTTFDDDAALVQGVRAGARGYLLKGVSPETLLEAIQTVARGGTYLYVPPVSDLTREDIRASTPPDAALSVLDTLTGRETEILRLMVSGIGNREIAAALSLSEGTVKNHVTNIFSKLAVTDRTKAVLRAIAMGLV